MSIPRAKRFVPGYFQRSVVDIEEEILDQEEYIEYWEKKKRDAEQKRQELLTSQQKLQDLMGFDYDETNDERFAEQIDEVQAKIDDAKGILRTSRADLQALTGLRKGIQYDPQRVTIMAAMINTNFAETYGDKVCTSSYADTLYDIYFDENDETGEKMIYYNKGGFPCARSTQTKKPKTTTKTPIFLKLEEPGHLLCALIFPAENLCELWNTAPIAKNVQQYFVAMLPHYYTIRCVNAQLQIKWCASGDENVYTVKQPGAKTMVNIYCQTWPFFFAYMRCVKHFGTEDLIKFLSCLTDAQKTQLIDAFNTALANRGRDIQYISEINDVKHFQQYVRSCKPLLNLGKFITYATRSDEDEEDDSELDDEEKENEFATKLRAYIKV